MITKSLIRVGSSLDGFNNRVDDKYISVRHRLKEQMTPWSKGSL